MRRGRWTWSMSAAFLTTSFGRMFGCAALYYALRRGGDAQLIRLLNRAGGPFGMSSDRVEQGLASFRRKPTALSILSRPAWAGHPMDCRPLAGRLLVAPW